MSTKSPPKYAVLYDGHCKFCTGQSKRLAALARPGALELLDFQEPGVLSRFPGLTHEACMQAMHLVTPTGRVFRGFEAIVQALATRRLVGLLAYTYYLPGLRPLCDWFYDRLAANRYRLMGQNQECTGGTCSLHVPPRQAGLKR
jgi:predicted DCC family thiol-disulfide oxidoreductase YuxK